MVAALGQGPFSIAESAELRRAFRLCLGRCRGTPGLKRFLRYFRAEAETLAEERAFRVYVTDTLRALGRGLTPARRWADDLPERAPAPTGDEIAAAILRGAGLRRKGSAG